MPWVVVFVVCIGIVLTFRSVIGHAAGVSSDIKSGVHGYCLDDHDDAVNNAIVDSWGCNGSDAQNWAITFDTIKHDNDQCLSVADNGTSVGDSIVLSNVIKLLVKSGSVTRMASRILIVVYV